jgi:hypothetical protein
LVEHKKWQWLTLCREPPVRRRLAALPPYQGGKRRLLGQIFRHLPRPAEAPVLVDAFLGGGSVSLYAKARGYRVVANDIALRSQIVGEALIANDRVTLGREDVTRLFVGNGTGPGFIEEHFADKVVTAEHARFLDTAFEHARTAAGVKQWLLLLLLTKYVFRMRPMGNFGARTIVQQAGSGAWEAMNPHYVRDMLVRGVADHPAAVAEVLRRQVNQGVFSNGLEGRLVRSEPSRFSRAEGVEMLERLLERAGRFPVWAISYGNSEVDLAGLVRVVERFRPVVAAEAFRYAHLTGLSGSEHRERNRELLVVARR